MRVWGLIAVLLSASLPQMVRADDQLHIGPAPAWVKPVAAAAGAEPQDQNPLHTLLSSRQIWFHGDTTSDYLHYAVRIVTPDGLNQMGTISMQWSPDTDRMTVHQLVIRRGSQVIDVLHSGQKFNVMRRETNLEQAQIDGSLTAALPLEGLQVGDIVEIATTLDRTEPLLQGHHDLTLDLGNTGNVRRLAMAASWLKSDSFAIKSQNLPASLARRDNSVSMTADTVTPLVLPQGAPDRFRRGRKDRV